LKRVRAKEVETAQG